MKYVSTRGGTCAITFSEALTQGLCADGGLFVPEKKPKMTAEEFDASLPLDKYAELWLTGFFDGDPLRSHLNEICSRAFNFPVPLRFLETKSAMLELFHGPTAAFKDFGARFLAECLALVPSKKRRVVLVATSGDTGGAVAAGFFNKPGIEVCVLYPKGRVSPRQEIQIAGWGGNVKALAVQGTFDDCQRLAKEAFADPEMNVNIQLLSANSINIARLVAQMTYFARASQEYFLKCKTRAGVIIPTGNLGHGVAALWVKNLGFPLDKVILATNANHSIVDYFSTGKWLPHATVSTLANAMDVGNPSNMERLRWLYPDVEKLKKDAAAISVSDKEIREKITASYKTNGEIWCPHTAVGLVAKEKLGGENWITVATAHAAKFETIVEPLIGKAVEIPEAFKSQLARKPFSREIPADLKSLKKEII